MATLMQLRAEPWWDREVITPELDWLGDELCVRTGRPRVAAGSKGDVAHLNGGHRSQEWIINSRWCTSRSYTVQRGLTDAQLRHIGAFDFTPGAWGTATNRRLVQEQTTRLVAAGRAGRLPGVVEVLGTLDGRNAVGVDVPEGQVWATDASHLEHWHLTFDRRRLTDRAVMERIIAVALGLEDDVSKEDVLAGLRAEAKWASPGVEKSATEAGEGADRSALVKLEYVLASTRYEGVALRPKTAALLDRLDKAATAGAASDQAVAAALTGLAELIRAGGGSPEVAALATRVDQLATAVQAAAGAITTLQATVATLVAQGEARDAALARAYGG